MADMMTFPDTVEEFMEQYKITDTDQVYTNGVEMVPIFRMKQWFEHQVRTQMSVPDCISRQAAIDAALEAADDWDGGCNKSRDKYITSALIELPSAQPAQRWIPCSERLPEEADCEYWVCTDTGYQCQCRWTDNVYGLSSNGEWAWKIFDIPQYSHVVAWMPLPEPWIGEEDE